MRAKRRCFFDGGHATRQDTYLIKSALSRNKTAERLLCGLSDAASFVLVCAHSDHFQSHSGRHRFSSPPAPFKTGSETRNGRGEGRSFRG